MIKHWLSGWYSKYQINFNHFTISYRMLLICIYLIISSKYPGIFLIIIHQIDSWEPRWCPPISCPIITGYVSHISLPESNITSSSIIPTVKISTISQNPLLCFLATASRSRRMPGWQADHGRTGEIYGPFGPRHHAVFNHSRPDKNPAFFVAPTASCGKLTRCSSLRDLLGTVVMATRITIDF